MNRHRQIQVVLAVLTVVLAIGCMWSGWRLRWQKAAAREATNDLASCMVLEGQIRRLQQRPKLIESQQLLEPELAKRIETAGTLAGIAASSFNRIDPESPRRVGDSAYKEIPVQVSLRGVVLRELVNFLYGLSTDGSGLQVREIRLSAPRDQQTLDQWNAEITLAYLIYAPKTSSLDSRPLIIVRPRRAFPIAATEG